jgi:hypothetical protein
MKLTRKKALATYAQIVMPCFIERTHRRVSQSRDTQVQVPGFFISICAEGFTAKTGEKTPPKDHFSSEALVFDK